MNHIQGKEEVIRFQKRSPESGWEVRVLGLLKNLTRREVGRKLTFQVSEHLDCLTSVLVYVLMTGLLKLLKGPISLCQVCECAQCVKIKMC